jgi:FAD:protein FMN transferase
MRLSPARGGSQRVYRTAALGTIAEVVVSDAAVIVAASELLEAELARMDRVASRFRDDSELSALNRCAGTDTLVSADLFEAIDVALGMAEATGGVVDPTVGPAMVGIGYDRDFGEVRDGVAGHLPSAHPVVGWTSVVLDRARRSVCLAVGSSLDLGATAKALAADRAASDIARHCGCGVLVSLGGDIAVAGTAPDGGFAVGLADACTDRADHAVSICGGGLATSGIGVRRWSLGGRLVHHIVDPRTGLPVDVVWRTVTTTAASCVQANAASTASMVLGPDAPAWLESRSIPTRLVGADGTVVTTAGWPTSSATRDGVAAVEVLSS